MRLTDETRQALIKEIRGIAGAAWVHPKFSDLSDALVAAVEGVLLEHGETVITQFRDRNLRARSGPCLSLPLMEDDNG